MSERLSEKPTRRREAGRRQRCTGPGKFDRSDMTSVSACIAQSNIGSHKSSIWGSGVIRNRREGKIVLVYAVPLRNYGIECHVSV